MTGDFSKNFKFHGLEQKEYISVKNSFFPNPILLQLNIEENENERKGNTDGIYHFHNIKS